MKITVYKAEDGYRWRARAANGEIVSESGEAYRHKSSRAGGSETVRTCWCRDRLAVGENFKVN
jgi:uncharacterized protein YegP (UPF0339 family)